ncbi:hypothetical protein Thiowin_01892 [Thiorhodovibrio winogradskyi]|uniref:Uncharacterized protein n=1 Tax=Thiorhodovibrio winogradskyi TaxID=77007 RepID=A0ABZ0S8Z5_9GAMM|nr:hypothetical protein [Thiorhodovibrio winogradskyi]
MSIARHRKIALSHTQKVPAWAVEETDPSAWLEHSVRPLLAGLPVAVTMAHDFAGRKPNQDSFPDTALVVGDVRLNKERDYDTGIGFYLYWIGSQRHVAIAPREIGQRWRYPYDRLSDCRYFAEPGALVALVHELHQFIEEQKFNAHKREKVRNLQRQAIIGQLRELANQEQFAFFVENTARLIKISIRLSDHLQVTISVPFSEFENTLPQIREMVLNLRALHERKIRVKTAQARYSAPWILPESPDPGAAA